MIEVLAPLSIARKPYAGRRMRGRHMVLLNIFRILCCARMEGRLRIASDRATRSGLGRCLSLLSISFALLSCALVREARETVPSCADEFCRYPRLKASRK